MNASFLFALGPALCATAGVVVIVVVLAAFDRTPPARRPGSARPEPRQQDVALEREVPPHVGVELGEA